MQTLKRKREISAGKKLQTRDSSSQRSELNDITNSSTANQIISSGPERKPSALADSGTVNASERKADQHALSSKAFDTPIVDKLDKYQHLIVPTVTESNYSGLPLANLDNRGTICLVHLRGHWHNNHSFFRILSLLNI